ncbi:MAG: hypothetical protein GF364_07390, partial [Candidatus Lokiarchaeota archaeon]|nr:hypothetical protein [Candidatus Lokiarchaeota archaeon]
MINILVFTFVVTTFNGVAAEQGLFSLVVGGLLFAATIYAIDPVLGFFRFPKNFWAYLIIGTIFSLIYFIVLKTLLLGILSFGVGSIGGDFGPIEFFRVSLEDEMVSVIFASVYASSLSLL